jgi:hypothetical protein
MTIHEFENRDSIPYRYVVFDLPTGAFLFLFALLLLLISLHSTARKFVV